MRTFIALIIFAFSIGCTKTTRSPESASTEREIAQVTEAHPDEVSLSYLSLQITGGPFLTPGQENAIPFFVQPGIASALENLTLHPNTVGGALSVSLAENCNGNTPRCDGILHVTPNSEGFLVVNVRMTANAVHTTGYRPQVSRNFIFYFFGSTAVEIADGNRLTVREETRAPWKEACRRRATVALPNFAELQEMIGDSVLSMAGTQGEASVQKIVDWTTQIPTTDSVELFYHHFLNRAGDEGGVTFWRDFLPVNSTHMMARHFINSPEYRDLYVTAAYDYYLGRAPETGAAEFWTQLSVAEIEAGIINSEEFTTRSAGGFYCATSEDQTLIRTEENLWQVEEAIRAAETMALNAVPRDAKYVALGNGRYLVYHDKDFPGLVQALEPIAVFNADASINTGYEVFLTALRNAKDYHPEGNPRVDVKVLGADLSGIYLQNDHTFSFRLLKINYDGNTTEMVPPEYASDIFGGETIALLDNGSIVLQQRGQGHNGKIVWIDSSLTFFREVIYGSEQLRVATNGKRAFIHDGHTYDYWVIDDEGRLLFHAYFPEPPVSDIGDARIVTEDGHSCYRYPYGRCLNADGQPSGFGFDFLNTITERDFFRAKGFRRFFPRVALLGSPVRNPANGDAALIQRPRLSVYVAGRRGYAVQVITDAEWKAISEQ